MDVIEMGFANGLQDCVRVWDDDTRRRNFAKEEMEQAQRYRSRAQMQKLAESTRDCDLPLWQRISGLSNDTAERALRPMLRRERIRKLLKAADQILRAELASPVSGPTDSAEQKASLNALKAERSVFWDPLPEMCFYLEIGQSKLAQYARQLTGLGAKDLVDRIRVENLRAALRERLRKVASRMQEFTKEDVTRLSRRDGAGLLLKALKASEHFVSRQALALSVGIASKARLYRACLACERAALEEIEREEAEAIFAEARETAPVRMTASDTVVPIEAGVERAAVLCDAAADVKSD